MQQAFATIYDEAIAKGEARGIAKGEARGIIRGKVALVLRLLEARGLEPSPTQHARIASCTEGDTLDRWFDRAIGARSADELFEV